MRIICRTDEDTFRTIASQGIGIRVGRADIGSAARYTLNDSAEVRRILLAQASALAA